MKVIEQEIHSLKNSIKGDVGIGSPATIQRRGGYAYRR